MISISRRGFLIINGRPLTKFEAACAVAERHYYYYYYY